MCTDQQASSGDLHAGASNGDANGAAVDTQADRLAAARLQAAEDAPAAKGGKRRMRKVQNGKIGQQNGRGVPADHPATAAPNAVPKATKDMSATACLVCGADFTSRTRLFRHIKESGHAALRG